jgi:LysM repeat protein
MKSRHLFLFALLTLLTIILLSACVRPASTPPKSETVSGTTTTEFPVPGTTEDVMSQLESLATQTAMALTGGTPGAQQPPAATQPAAGTSAPSTDTSGTAAPTTEGQVQPTAAAPTVAPTQAPAQPQVAVPTRTPGKPSSYTLKGGEFPYCIARRFDVNPSEMLNLSGLPQSGVYPPGTVLKIPQSGGGFPGARSLRETPDTYSVSSGDTIYSIACLYGKVDPNEIAYANNLSSPYTLKVGQELNIP